MSKIFIKKISFLLVTILLPALLSTLLNIEKYTNCIKTLSDHKMNVIFDTDANNEIDDQLALAYLLFNGDHFNVEGVTVNATYGGGEVDLHYEEAERILKLSAPGQKIPLYKGANDSFGQIKKNIQESRHDGYKAVDFIIERAQQERSEKLVILAVGKLTNVALALKKEPSISSNIHVIWLGSNYPAPGEYNQDNDPESLNYILNSKVPFDIVTVRYDDPSGTDAVKVTLDFIRENMPGRGPDVNPHVSGRHGGTYSNFGDYAVSLFDNYPMKGTPPSRPLYDMAAVAIIKNPSWATSKKIPAPVLIDNEWEERPENLREITLWENFDIYGIMYDFFVTMENPVLIKKNKSE